MSQRSLTTKLHAQHVKEKARWARIKRTYGLTKEDYDTLDLGYCPICLRNWSGTVRPAVDHDHKSLEVRGILCLYCNRYVVGRHRDAATIRRVADYLDKPFTGYTAPPKKRKRRKKK